MAANKRKTICCMYASVTSRDDLEDMLESIREDAECELERGPFHVSVEMSE